MLTLLGATGYAGRLCAAEAARQGLPLRLAGRRRDALEGLAAGLGGPPVATVDVHDRAALTALARQSTVLLTTVGPYARLGAPAVDAALSGGCHYLDVSGEVGFLEGVWERDGEAVEAGVALCPGFGFDGLIGEVLAARAAAALGGDVHEVRVAHLVRGWKASAGSIRSVLGMAATGGVTWRDGAAVAEPVGARCWTAPFPSPLGPRPAFSVPTPEVLTAGRSTGAPAASAYLVAPAARAVPLVAAPLGAAAQALAASPAWAGIGRVTDRLEGGPAPERRRRARAALLAEAVGPNGTRRAWARLRDIYGTMARVAVGAAARLLTGGPPRAGVLTPSQLFGDDAGTFLDDVGARWAVLGAS